jgi:hypothetical protein
LYILLFTFLDSGQALTVLNSNLYKQLNKMRQI